MILHYIYVRHSKFKVGAVSKNKSHHKKLRYGETVKGKERERVRDRDGGREGGRDVCGTIVNGSSSVITDHR